MCVCVPTTVPVCASSRGANEAAERERGRLRAGAGSWGGEGRDCYAESVVAFVRKGCWEVAAPLSAPKVGAPAAKKTAKKFRLLRAGKFCTNKVQKL